MTTAQHNGDRVLTLDEQKKLLWKMAPFAEALPRRILAGAGICLFAALLFRHPAPLMIGAFLGFAGFAARESTPRVLQAAKALRSGSPTEGMVTIRITNQGEDTAYSVVLRQPSRPDWEFPFRPQGWLPTEGDNPVRVWRTSPSLPPAALTTKDGLIIPSGEPRQPGRQKR